MKILVTSDSHDESDVLQTLLEEYAATVHLVIHLGDHDRDLLRLAPITDLPLLTVSGNTDDEMRSPRERVCTFFKKKFFLTHGHIYNINAGVDALARKALEEEARVCLYGHTHVANTFNRHGILFMNPGSLSDPRDDNPPSYGLLTIDEKSGEIAGEIKYL